MKIIPDGETYIRDITDVSDMALLNAQKAIENELQARKSKTKKKLLNNIIEAINAAEDAGYGVCFDAEHDIEEDEQVHIYINSLYLD